MSQPVNEQISKKKKTTDEQNRIPKTTNTHIFTYILRNTNNEKKSRLINHRNTYNN